MNKKILTIGIIAIIVVMLGILFYGLTSQTKTTPNKNQTNPNTITDANNKFATDLYLKYRSTDGNIFFSPYSIMSALTMTYEGAKGKTAEEMRTVLHLPDNKEKIRFGFVSINKELNKENKTYQLNVANALWAQKEYIFVNEFFNTVKTYYGGKVDYLDFIRETEKSRTIINNWAENETKGKIKDLIPKSILSNEPRLVLTNAIYFKANWSKQFDPKNTHDGQFKLSSGAIINATMMSQTNFFNYGETSDIQILEMDYLGNDLSMLIILPKENNINKIENILSEEKLSEWKGLMKNEKVIVALPKFKFETKYFMAKDLKEMGMPTAFNLYADFTGISPTGELYIKEVIHQTFIEVAEYGTEAAAATAVIMPAIAPFPTEEPKRFIADHPFIFIIQQKESGNILFMGRLSTPNQ